MTELHTIMATNAKNNLKTAAGIAGIAAAAAATYYFAVDKNAAKHRKNITAWAGKAKKEVLSEVKRLQVVTKPAYEAAISTVLEKYQQNKDVTLKELGELSRELKGYWKQISTGAAKAASNKKSRPNKPGAKRAPKA